jgi:two-component system response regulator QseB
MVILDLTMPKLDGTEVLRQIRQVTPYIPVAIYSNLPEDVLISKVRETNQQANGYFTKPSRLEALETVALDFRRCYEAVAIRLQ